MDVKTYVFIVMAYMIADGTPAVFVRSMSLRFFIPAVIAAP